ncbi:exopolysaccharide biosynthesis protein [Pseudahrensia aquimaris]|uniref:Exopolysaccharide biosynthesis protein n=1 Tax=Pseudahrensia aquimaris TaxID=744461 RepID=A0ABW3FBV7_9HYPH
MAYTQTNDQPILGTTALLDDVLARLVVKHGAEARISLGALTDTLESRAYGVILLLMALPCCLPFVYGLPQIVALPMLFLIGQLAIGRTRVWLPESLRKREFSINLLAKTVARGRPWLKRFEIVAGPRVGWVSEGLGLRIIGALLLIPCASILVPLPLTNTVPGLGVAIAAIGLIERDGLLILFGLIVGLIWVAALIIGGQAAITFLIDFVRNLI